MLRANTKIFDGRPLRLELVGAASERRIRTVAVLNNTPYFMYVGMNQRPGREDAIFVVEPYTDVVMPVNAPQELFVLEGPSIGVIPVNCQAVVQWGPDVLPLSYRKTGRNVVIPVFKQAAQGSTSSNLTAQGLGSGAAPSGPVPFAIPASARRRTLYGQSPTTFTSAALSGSFDGVTWFKVVEFPTGAATFIHVLNDALALPPYLRLDANGGVGASITMVVDL